MTNTFEKQDPTEETERRSLIAQVTPLKTGRQMKERLELLGVSAQKISRSQENGDYIADFFVPNLETGTLPSAEWAKRISDVLPDARIIHLHDTIATWRNGQPVLIATVFFSVGDKPIYPKFTGEDRS